PRSHVPQSSHANALRRRRRFLEKTEDPLHPCFLSRTGQGRRRNRRGEATFSGGGSQRVGSLFWLLLPGAVLSTLRSGQLPPRWRLTTCVGSLLCFSASGCE